LPATSTQQGNQGAISADNATFARNFYTAR
jgi:hypothetical protein